MLKEDLKTKLGHDFHLQILMDRPSCFDVLTKNSTTTEKRLFIEIASGRKSYDPLDISDIGHIRSQYNCANGLNRNISYPSL